jgi:hypothetical protein
MKTNVGNDLQALQMASPVGFSGTASATTATSLTSTGFTNGAYVGSIVTAGTVYGVITANTTTVLTVDRWYNPASPGGAAGSTPSGTSTFVITPGGAPAFFVGLTANSTAPAAGDTTLAGEITTAGGGLIRKIAAYAHTTGAASYTLTAAFTANGTDSLPVTVAKAGVFPSLTAAALMQFETLLTPSTATLSASGDQVTTTSTVTL